MGIGRSLRHGVKKVTKAVGHISNPVALTKSATTTVRRALHGDLKGALGEALNYTNKSLVDLNGGHNPAGAETERSPTPGFRDEERGAFSGRIRRVVRQGMQGIVGKMLLGQGVDFDRLRLGKDQELGEK